MNRSLRHITVIGIACVLDTLLGDPPTWPHPVRLIGKQIELEENLIRTVVPEATPAEEKVFGAAMVVDVITIPVVKHL